MGRKKRPNANQNAQQQDHKDPKKARASHETGESYLVKKYRPTKIYASMEAFVKYTKSHRMLDASYVRWKTGVTPERPFVFSTRVGGVDLGWGRGKTREGAMDCACRAAFALVAAHGYNNFPLDDDCLMEAPNDPPPPPPPPPAVNPHAPPLPPGLPPLGYHPGMGPPHHLPPLPNGMPPLPLGVPHGAPPLPHGVPPIPPGLPPPPPAHLPPPPLPSADLIPQAQMVSNAAPTASSLSSSLGNTEASQVPLQGASKISTVSMSLNGTGSSSTSEANKAKKKLKGGLTLVYAPEGEGADEMSMEETRALLPRYLKVLSRASSIHASS